MVTSISVALSRKRTIVSDKAWVLAGVIGLPEKTEQPVI